MASPNSWLSPDLMQALGWALIHSLWQGVAAAALAAIAMTFIRRASVRYLIAVGALALMLAAPVATLFLQMKSDAPVRGFLPAISGSSVSSAPAVSASVRASSSVVPATAAESGAARVLENLAPASPNILPWLVGAWLLGVALFGLRFAGGFLLLEQRRRSQCTAPKPRIVALCRELERQLGLTRAVRYLECSWLETPAVIGWLRPIILLPVSVLTGLSEEQLRAVIAHELAHIRRLDALVNLFQILAETLLFYHPAMWWLNRRIRAERELCCDEIAVSLTGNRVEYARALTAMAEWKAAPLLAMAANRAPLSTRILHILGRKPVSIGQRLLGLSGGLLFLAATLGAANALLGLAYPVPVAQAKETGMAAGAQLRQVLSATPPGSVDAVSEPAVIAPSSAPLAAPADIPTRRELGAHDMETKALATRLAAFAAPLVLASTVSAQPLAEPSNDTVDNVIVTAPRLRPEKALDSFIIAHAKASPALGKISRWSDGVCPITIGLPAKFNQYVTQRIIRVAMTAGAPLAPAEPCRTNVIVLATPQPQALLDFVRTKRPELLGFHYKSRAVRHATMKLPVQAWYSTATEDARGFIQADLPQLSFEMGELLASQVGGGVMTSGTRRVTGNRTGDGLKSQFTTAIIIVDTTKIAGQEIGPISDYIAMLALSQGQYYDVCQDIPTITNLMAAGCGPEMKPVALTDIDVTYLRGLYRMSPGLSYVGQRGSIAFNMKKTLGGY